MTDRALKLINMVLSHEGGYSSGNERQTKGDKGKETYRGISRVYNPSWKGWSIIDKHKPIKYNKIIKDDNLEYLVKNYYYDNYYTPLKCDCFNSILIAGHLFCHGVNAGIKTSVKLLQKAINVTYGVKLDIDGIIGSNTLKYANGSRIKDLEQEFICQRRQYYNKIVSNNPSQKKFIKGWLNRINNTTNTCSSSCSVLFTSFDTDNLINRLLSFIYDVFKYFFKK